MDLGIDGRLFLVTGATSGFGKSTALALLDEGAKVVINARREEPLQEMQEQFPEQLRFVAGDVAKDDTLNRLVQTIGNERLDGVFVNAGGPPAKSFLETEISDWDAAYRSVLQWKVKLANHLLPIFERQKYGRFVFIESVSVKQPIENLVLSNAFRLAVLGFVKTLSQEIGHLGITANLLAPGYHATQAMERLFQKKATLLGIDAVEARREFEKEIMSGQLGDPDDLATLAVWLLSPHSRYVTGQTIVIDGGLSKGTM